MTLTELFANIATAIRSKTGGTAKIKPTDFATEISNIKRHTKSVVLTNQRRRDTTGDLSCSWSGAKDVFVAASIKANNEASTYLGVWVQTADGKRITIASGSQQGGAFSRCGYYENCVAAGCEVSWPTADGNYSDTSLAVIGLYD